MAINTVQRTEIETRELPETVLGLIAHAASAPATIRARKRRRAEMVASGEPVVTATRFS
jgi:hypothetical protein